jgi:hypothetical protein
MARFSDLPLRSERGEGCAWPLICSSNTTREEVIRQMSTYTPSTPKWNEVGRKGEAVVQARKVAQAWFWTGLGAGIAVLAGACLPWVTANDGLQTYYAYGMGHNAEAPFFAVAGAALIVLALVLRLKVRTGALIALGCVSAFAVIDAISMIGQTNTAFQWFSYLYGVQVKLSVGLPLVMFGGIAGLVATGLGWAALNKARQAA